MRRLDALLSNHGLEFRQMPTDRGLVEPYQLIQLGSSEMRCVNRNERIHELGGVAMCARQEGVPEGGGNLRVGGALCARGGIHSARRSFARSRGVSEMPTHSCRGRR